MANTQLQFLLISVCILVTQTTKGAFGMVNSSLNRVVYQGATNTRITCGNDIPLMDWKLYPFAYTGTSDTIDISTLGNLNPPFNEFFAIEEYHSPGTHIYTLVVFNATISPPEGATFSTAGLYECGDFYAWEVRDFHMVVVQTDPICSSSLTGDVIQLFCTIVYGAYRQWPIDANMTWSVNGEPIPADNFTITSSPTEVTASSILLINDNYEAIYECKATFSAPHEPFYGMATNAPDYSKTCTISPATTTTTITSTSATTTTTTGLPPCSGLFQFVSDLLKASCYTDWTLCSSEINILGIIIYWPDCRKHCRSQSHSSGTCISSSTSVGCPCIHPGNKKCKCSE